MTYWNLTDDFSSCSAYDGSKIHVIGHGLLGPKSGFSPSVCSGVVANVVKAKIPSSYHQGDSLEYFPPILETTAVVHPGSSGGAVVNSEGRMIGLVTSLMYEQDYGDRNESGMYENFCFLV